MSDTLLNNEHGEESLFKFTNNSFSFQVFSIALSSFYRKTQISGKISFTYVPNEDSVMIDLSFSKIPNDSEYLMFLDEIKIAERFVVANSFLSYLEDSTEMEEINEMKDKFSKEAKAAGIYLDIDMQVEK